jgi:uncharacterized protein (DUF697 family)
MNTHNTSLIPLSSQGEATVLQLEHNMAWLLSHMFGMYLKNSNALGITSMLAEFSELNIHYVAQC